MKGGRTLTDPKAKTIEAIIEITPIVLL